METIYRYALKGKGNMPPKGGSNASDTDVKAAVDYMLKSVKQKGEGHSMKWTDIQDIAIALAEIHPDTDPKTVRFKDLYRWVRAREVFEADPKRAGGSLLQAIESVWIEEAAAFPCRPNST